MTLLLDTCTFIWLTSEPDRLGPAARRALDVDGAAIALSQVSVLDLSLTWHAGKLRLPAPPRTWIPGQIERWELRSLALEDSHLYRATELPDHHRDPFDRLLVAQGIEEGASLVSPDPWIHRYPVQVIW